MNTYNKSIAETQSATSFQSKQPMLELCLSRGVLMLQNILHMTVRDEMHQLEDVSLEENDATGKVILIVEDDPSIGEFLKMAISQETPYHPLLAETGEQALEILAYVKPSLFVLDYVLSTMNGLDLYDSLYAQQDLEAIPAIILSASLQKFQEEIDRRHLVGLIKPIDLDELLLSINRALSMHQEPA